MKRLLTLSVLGFALVSQAADRWAAVVWSPSQDFAFIARAELSEQLVRDHGLRACGYKDCIVMALTKNLCVSYARSQTTDKFGRYWLGFSNGADADNAEDIALGICEKNAQGFCRVSETYCIGDDDSVGKPSPTEWIAKLGENSKEARAVVKLTNTVAYNYLVTHVGVAGSTAARIARYSNFVSLTDLATRAKLTTSELERLLAFALQHGWLS